MSRARKGDTVRVHYAGRFENGELFDSSAGGRPLEFTLGEGKIIPGLEKAVLGMALGETRRHTILAADAYGEHHPEMIFNIDRSMLPAEICPEVGQRLEVTHENGITLPVTVIAVSEIAVTLDANHPLAGHDLTFDLTLIAIIPRAKRAA